MARDSDELMRRVPDLLRRVRIRPGTPPRPYEAGDGPAAALPGCLRRFLVMVLLLVALLIAMALFAGGPLLHILLNILLSS